MSIMEKRRIAREAKEAKKQKMIEILKSHGIEMMVGGCGCCDSPWITFKYQGEELFNSENVPFTTEQ